MVSAENGRARRSYVGEEIRQLRQAKGLTLRDLAKRSGRSLGYLSQIERGLVEPSLKTLKNIAQALAVEVTWFFPPVGGVNGREYGTVVRSQTRRRLSVAYQLDTEALGYEDYLLSGSLDLDLCMGLSRISPGGSTNAKPETYDVHMCGYIAKGTVTLEIDEESFVLFEGDSFSFDTRRAHNFTNTGEQMAEMVWSIAPSRLKY